MVGRRGRRWATLFLFTVSTSCSFWQLYVAFAHVQGSFRDPFPCSFPEIPGALESSQRAALVGDTSIRTAGIVEPSVSQKVDGGPEEGHGHGIYVIIVLIDSCLCDIISTEIRCKIDANFFSRNRIRFRAFPTKPGVSRLARGRFFRASTSVNSSIV